jgi:ribosomal-protein-alanine N-acetyltransferase
MGPTLETSRLILRPWRDSDIDAWVALCADERVMEFFPSTQDREQSEAGAARLRERFDRDGYGWWAVEVKNGDAFAGTVVIQDVPYDAHFTPALEVGWRLSVANWGRGYATEAARAALDFAFAKLGCSEIVAMTMVANVRSRRVMERLGMSRDPRDDFDHPLLAPGHPIRPHVLYRIGASAFVSGARGATI